MEIHIHAWSILHGQLSCSLFTREAKNLVVQNISLLSSGVLSCCFHPFTSLLFPQVPGGSEEGPSSFHHKAHQLPFPIFFNLKLLRGRAEGPTAHLGPDCQKHGCYHLLSLSEKGWSFEVPGCLLMFSSPLIVQKPGPQLPLNCPLQTQCPPEAGLLLLRVTGLGSAGSALPLSLSRVGKHSPD